MKAFPAAHDKHLQEGMDLRDYFAAKAMQALLTSSNTTMFNGEAVNNSDQYAEVAYLMADQMMEARNGTA
jgi:hypothetical protein